MRSAASYLQTIEQLGMCWWFISECVLHYKMDTLKEEDDPKSHMRSRGKTSLIGTSAEHHVLQYMGQVMDFMVLGLHDLSLLWDLLKHFEMLFTASYDSGH